MIMKTMTITSIAILIAAVSVATTITMVQADPDSDLIALFGPLAGTIGVTPNPFLGGMMDHFYSDVTGSTAAAAFSSAASLGGGYLDASEPSIQSGGAPANPVFIPGFVAYTTAFGGCLAVVATPVDVYKGFEESVFTFDSLNAGQNYWVNVSISDMDDFGVFTENTCTTNVLETVFVSANTVELGSVVASVGAVAPKLEVSTVGVGKADPLGDMTVGFNQLFSWDPTGTAPLLVPVCGNIGVPLPCIGDQSGIRVEQIELTLASQSTGFWKNHESVVDALTDGMAIDLLDDGIILINDDSGIESDDIFQGTKKTKGDTRPQLAAQLLAAQLNIKNGAVTCSDATDAIADAQAALIALNYNGLGDGEKPKKNTALTKSEVNAIKDVLDDYNNNLLCPAP